MGIGKAVGCVTSALVGIGQSIESIPGWRRIERFLDDVAWGFAFAVALFWALRWGLILLVVAVVVGGR